LLGVEASLARVFQSGLKTDGGAIAEVASEANSRWTGQCDGLHQTLLPLICRFRSIRR
jgi:hypothetical protein